jgi:hypothetical protein
MPLPALIVALNLVELTGPDHQLVEVNPAEVAMIRQPRGQVETHFHKDIKCLIFTSDGKFVGVIETCEQVAEKFRTGVP